MPTSLYPHGPQLSSPSPSSPPPLTWSRGAHGPCAAHTPLDQKSQKSKTPLSVAVGRVWVGPSSDTSVAQHHGSRSIMDRAASWIAPPHSGRVDQPPRMPVF